MTAPWDVKIDHIHLVCNQVEGGRGLKVNTKALYYHTLPSAQQGVCAISFTTKIQWNFIFHNLFSYMKMIKYCSFDLTIGVEKTQTIYSSSNQLSFSDFLRWILQKWLTHLQCNIQRANPPTNHCSQMNEELVNSNKDFKICFNLKVIIYHLYLFHDR